MSGNGGPGELVVGWRVPPRPDGATLQGRLVRLERLAPSHAPALFAANQADRDGRNWDYLPYGPFAEVSTFAAWVDSVAGGADPLFYAIVPVAAGQAQGVLSYLRIAPEAGSIEVGHINLSPALQRSPAATEAIWLTMGWAFRAGYRRFEWKCNALNLASRRAAERFGLSHEGVFRQAAVIKGRNRDTAWFAAIDREWPALDAAFRQWLDPSNFDTSGRQRAALSEMTRPLLAARDPALAG